MRRSRVGLLVAVTACALLPMTTVTAAPARTALPEPTGPPAHSREAPDRVLRPPVPPRVLAAVATSGATYHYASAQSQYVRRARGAAARFTVHRPRQVQQAGDHSLAEIAVRGPDTRDLVEAGWRTNHHGVTRLFVYWWKNGRPQCYNRCGFVRRGPGIKPGTILQPGTAIVLEWRFARGRWVLRVNDKVAGFYPQRLWNRGFRRARLVQVFGEVVTASAVPCADMGNGRRPAHRRAASIRGVRFVRGPRMRLRGTQTSTSSGYALRLLHRRALRYGGAGQC